MPPSRSGWGGSFASRSIAAVLGGDPSDRETAVEVLADSTPSGGWTRCQTVAASRSNRTTDSLGASADVGGGWSCSEGGWWAESAAA